MFLKRTGRGNTDEYSKKTKFNGWWGPAKINKKMTPENELLCN